MGFLRRRGRRGERQGLPPESLERRAVLAVTPVVVGSELTIAIDSSDRLDTAYVRGSDGFIEVSTSRSFADPFRVADTAIAAVTVSGAGGAQGLILASGTIDASLAVDGVERIAFQQGAALSGDVGGRLPGGTLSVADPASTGGRIDLVAALKVQAVRAGVRASAIESADCCSVRNADLCFSYRGEGPRSGRMAAVIGC